jgi:hypothetical protein
MKLHRTILMKEMTGPIPLELTLGEVIAAGDVTNHYQTLVLAILSDFFKSGLTATEGQLDGIINLSSDATSSGVIETIKSLSPSEKVNLAQYLLDCVKVGNCALHNTTMSSSDWIRFVLQKQD